MSIRKFSIIVRLVILAFLIIYLSNQNTFALPSFNGKRAFLDIETQLSFGPRIIGSSAHSKEVAFITDSLALSGWTWKYQDINIDGILIRNIIASRSVPVDTQPILIGAHYDTRLLKASSGIFSSTAGIPGANDGASGVAVLLELARSLPKANLPVWLVFFDAEETYGIPGMEGSTGARAFVDNLKTDLRSVIIVDMVGDSDLSLYYEANSDPSISSQIWTVAAELGFVEFVPSYKHALLDDHTPFLEEGIPAAVVIDFDYPYWHTIYDTLDKVSPESLDKVGDTLWKWIINQKD